MKCGEGLLTAFGLGFTPHVQRQACAHLPLRAYAIDIALHLAIAPGAAFHRIGRGGEQRIVEKRQGFCQRGGQELLQRVTEGGKPLDATLQLGEFVESRLGPTAPSKQRGHLFHDRTQHTSLGPSTADAPQGLPFGFIEVTLDTQIPLGAQGGAWLGQPLFRAGRRLRRLRARPSFGQFGLRGCQALAGAGHGTSDCCAALRQDMKRADVMRDIPAHLPERRGRERRAIGGDPAEGQVACRQGRFPTLQKRSDVRVGGGVIHHLREDALVAAILDHGENAAGAVVELIGGHLS